MTDYYPDKWIIVAKSNENEPGGIMYKVLAGFYGGYANGDSWKLNSGITGIKKIKNSFHIRGYSGSIYVCHKEAEGVTGYSNSILFRLRTLGWRHIPMEEVRKIFRKRAGV